MSSYHINTDHTYHTDHGKEEKKNKLIFLLSSEIIWYFFSQERYSSGTQLHSCADKITIFSLVQKILQEENYYCCLEGRKKYVCWLGWFLVHLPFGLWLKWLQKRGKGLWPDSDQTTPTTSNLATKLADDCQKKWRENLVKIETHYKKILKACRLKGLVFFCETV